MAGNKILIVEDDRTLLEVLKYNLLREGYEVVTAINGAEALEIARTEKPDFVILDIMLPELSGFEVCRILRKEMTVPILMLTAKTEEVDKIVGLELGADDYMTKPFSVRELLGRVRAILRRVEMVKQEALSQQAQSKTIEVGNLKIDLSRHNVYLGEVNVELNPREYELLVFLVKNRGHVFSRDSLLEKVWGYNYSGDSRTVDVHIRWLRQKIENDPANPVHLLTVRGFGYKFEA